MDKDTTFKNCSFCSKDWARLLDFLNDQDLTIDGYMADLEELELGLYFFTHTGESCGTTLSIPVGEFFCLYEGPRFDESRYGKEDCPGHCLVKDELALCEAPCKNAFARKIIQLIIDYKAGRVDASTLAGVA